MSSILRIGRDNNNDIIISDQTVSRNHGIITFESNGNVYFEDLNSSNGSYVNGNRIFGKIRLQDTDILKVGKALVPWHDYKNRLGGLGGQPHSHQSPLQTPNPEPPRSSPPIDPVYDIQPNRSLFSGYLPVIIGIVLILVVALILFSKSSGSSKKSSDENSEKSKSSKNQVQVDEARDKDSDGDGIYDSKDHCPDQKGPTENNGCPFTDSDKDGTPDFEDDCRNEWGPKSNSGCPIEEESYSFRTQCPYCNFLSYEDETNKIWKCGDCGKSFYNCYLTNIEDHDGIKYEWLGDGDCDCDNCSDEN